VGWVGGALQLETGLDIFGYPEHIEFTAHLLIEGFRLHIDFPRFPSQVSREPLLSQNLPTLFFLTCGDGKNLTPAN